MASPIGIVGGLFRQVLRVDGRELPPNLLLIAKLAIVGLFLKGYVGDLPDVFAPTVPLLEGLPAPYFRLALQTALSLAAIALLFNYRIRTACVVIGIVFFVATMSNRVYYRNANFFVGLLFSLIGLQDRHRPSLLTWQLGVMYLGCGLNKLFEADWRSGQYFAHYLPEIHGSLFYAHAAPLLPAGWLAVFLCWSVIAAELTAGALFFVPSLTRMGVWCAASVHAGAAMMVGMDYGIFLSVVLASYLVVVNWPESLVVRPASRPVRLLAWMQSLSIGSRLQLQSPLGPRTIVEADGRRLTGWGAFWRLAMWTPGLYFVTMAVVTSARPPWITRLVRGIGLAVSLLLVVALVTWLRKRWPPAVVSARGSAGERARPKATALPHPD